MNYAIVLGMRANELMEPYHPEIEPDRHRLDAVIEGTEVIECRSYFEAERTLDLLLIMGLENIMIVGAWAQYCVAGIIAHALKRGIPVYSPEKGLFYDSNPNERLKDLPTAVSFWNKGAVQYQYDYIDEVHLFTPQKTSESS